MLGLLEQLSERQLTDLFTHSRVFTLQPQRRSARRGAWYGRFRTKRARSRGGPVLPGAAITTGRVITRHPPFRRSG